MVLVSSKARARLDALEEHYAMLGRDIATIRLTEAIAIAVTRIEEQAGPFWSAPRPYPELVTYGWRWLNQARYWIAFTPIPGGYSIMGVFFETVNIPGRL